MPTTTPEHDRRIAEMTFSSVYPHYVTKVEKKGRTVKELHEVIRWLTGFTDKQIQKHIDVYKVAGWGLVDDVIDPRDTRRALAWGLELARQKKVERPAKKRGVIPV